jgi:hypothetical protein
VHQDVVEIKTDREAELTENQEGFGLIAQLLTEYGYQFRLWKQSEICAEPRLTNVGLVLRYRCAAIPSTESERIRRVYSAVPEWRVQELCKLSDASIQSVLRLVFEGTLHIDWWEPLTLDSRVSRVPIGRQVWPCAPVLPRSAIREVQMSYALRPGQTVKIGPVSFLILQKLTCGSWRARNNESGEWCTFAEEDLLERFTRTS